jgi:hypothetical protein
MRYTVKGKEIYGTMGFALLTISLEIECYWNELYLCGEVAPGIAAAFAIAMLIRSLVDENKWCRTYQTIVPSQGEMIAATIPIQTRPSRCITTTDRPYDRPY